MNDGSTGSTLSAPKGRHRPDWESRFLDVFAATGNVRLATSAAGCSRSSPYKRAQVSSAFAERWAEAREAAVDMLEAEARRRALASSDSLLVFLLKSERPAKYREKVDVTLNLRREAERIATRLGVDAEATIAEAERILAQSGA